MPTIVLFLAHLSKHYTIYIVYNIQQRLMATSCK